MQRARRDLIKNSNPKILIIQLYRIGDILLSTPVAHEIKRLLPGARVYYLVEKGFYDVVAGNKDIDGIFTLQKKCLSQLKLIKDLRMQKFDVIFDLLGNPRSALISFLSGASVTIGFDYRIRKYFYHYVYKRDHRPQYAVDFKFNLLRLCGLNPEDMRTKFYFSESDKKKAEDVLGALGLREKDFVILSTTSRRETRRWLPEYFVRLSEILYEKTGMYSVLVWGPGEREYVYNIYEKSRNSTKLLPQLTIKEIGALFSRALLYIGNDNGLKHLSVAIGLPTMTIFGPTPPSHWSPESRFHRWLRANLDCLECGKIECEDIRCMRQLSPEYVADETMRFIMELKEISVIDSNTSN